MAKHILITGGAGFLGSHVADVLLRAGHQVRALDNLSPQVHGPNARRPSYLDRQVDLVVADVRDPGACRRALVGIDMVYHLAASVGVGQSMYEITRYTDVNNVGTATLLEAVAESGIERLVVASSMSVYGEGLYRDSRGGLVADVERAPGDLRRGQWDVIGDDGERLTPLPTPESKAPALASVYALSKYDQERLCLVVGRAYGIPVVALRFFNIYGPRQALSNPYTGVLAIFAARLMSDRPPLINEDGQQRRDFINVSDAAEACLSALAVDARRGLVLNIGSGVSHSVYEVAQLAARAFGRNHINPAITGSFRIGDIRHCYADIAQARAVLGWQPQVSLEDGLAELAAWLDGQVADDRVEAARAELTARGLAV
jgi:dTDP-L-rhamnose 4-epimerase